MEEEKKNIADKFGDLRSDNKSSENYVYNIEDEYFAEDKTTHRSFIAVILLIISIIGFGAVAWYAYNLQSKNSKSTREILIIKADNAPTKIEPQDPGGMIIPDMDKTIYDAISGSKNKEEKVERILPAPEEPIDLSQRLIENKQAEIEQEKLAEIAKIENEQKMQSPNKLSENILPEQNDDKNKSVIEVKKNNEPINNAPKEIANNVVEDKAIENKPDLAEISIEDIIKADMQINKSTKSLQKIDKKTEINQVQKVKKGYYLQLASFKNPKDVHVQWNKIQKKYASIIGKYSHYAVKKDLGDKGVVYRLYIGMIKQKAEARALCKSLSSKKQACIVIYEK
jgi:cell division septation protein DedD